MTKKVSVWDGYVLIVSIRKRSLSSSFLSQFVRFMTCKRSMKSRFFFFFSLNKVASSEGRSSHNTCQEPCLSKDGKTKPAKLVLMVTMMSLIHRLSRVGRGYGKKVEMGNYPIVRGTGQSVCDDNCISDSDYITQGYAARQPATVMWHSRRHITK